jgi:hypothetical protein
MKAETMKLGYVPFGISLVPETDNDKEILKKLFDNDVRITAYDENSCCMVLELKFKHRYIFKGENEISPEELAKEFGFTDKTEK